FAGCQLPGRRGPEAVRVAGLDAELTAERRHRDRAERARTERAQRYERLAKRIHDEQALLPELERLGQAAGVAHQALAAAVQRLEDQARAEGEAGEALAGEMRECSTEEYRLQGELQQLGEQLTTLEVRSAQARDRQGEVARELAEAAAALERELTPATEALADDRRAELHTRLERLARRREQLGPVNPLAQQAYDDAQAHVTELEGQREDLDAALKELEGLIADTDRRIRESFEQTFEQTAANFEQMVAHLFPGGEGRLRLVAPPAPKRVIGDQDGAASGPDVSAPWAGDGEAPTATDAAAEDGEQTGDAPGSGDAGVEIEVRPAGKSMRNLSLMSGGEKSLVAIAFLFAVFLARPCPFYVLDEVEAALDDANIDRFLQLVRRYADRAQFIVVTHQKRTMDAADVLYGVTMRDDGVSRVVSRRLEGAREGEQDGEEAEPGPAVRPQVAERAA
ncbi:MAG: AAA family ATPase, partial [Solirubrobacterales bacterium]